MIGRGCEIVLRSLNVIEGGTAYDGMDLLQLNNILQNENDLKSLKPRQINHIYRLFEYKSARNIIER